MRDGLRQAVRWLAVVGVVGLLVVLVRHLGRPGYSHGRFALFAALGLLAVAGAVGVLRESATLVTLGSGGLFLLGFWQAVLWVYVYPVVALLVSAALLDHERAGPTPS